MDNKYSLVRTVRNAAIMTGIALMVEGCATTQVAEQKQMYKPIFLTLEELQTVQSTLPVKTTQTTVNTVKQKPYLQIDSADNRWYFHDENGNKISYDKMNPKKGPAIDTGGPSLDCLGGSLFGLLIKLL